MLRRMMLWTFSQKQPQVYLPAQSESDDEMDLFDDVDDDEDEAAEIGNQLLLIGRRRLKAVPRDGADLWGPMNLQ